MDDRTRYVAIEIIHTDDAIEMLLAHLAMNRYDFYFVNAYHYTLLVNEDETGYIDTILEDRNIEYKYK